MEPRANNSGEIQEKVRREIWDEYNRKIVTFQNRDDFTEDLEYFLKIISLSLQPAKLKGRFNEPFAGFYCISVPLEILDSLGLHPIRLWGSSSHLHRFSSSLLPALTCPVIKSCIGSLSFDGSMEDICDIIILPNTCSARLKTLEMAKHKSNKFYVMEVPYNKESEKNKKRWLEEVYALKRYLEEYANKSSGFLEILNSINKYSNAWKAFECLLDLRRNGLISGTWIFIVANAFMLDNIESWITKVNKLVRNYNALPQTKKPKILLVGSPLFFPNLKIAELIEKAGMFIAADDLCSSERLFRSVVYKDASEYGLISAVADRYLLPCKCPVFSDTEQKVRNMLATMQNYNYDIKGVIFHVLKGCQLFDIESYRVEKLIKENGFYFLKIETDYSTEDTGNIMARLESFKAMLCQKL